MDSWLDEALLLTVISVDLLMVGVLMRTLTMHPVPAFGRLSLRGISLRVLAAGKRTTRIKCWCRDQLHRSQWLRFFVYTAVLCGVVLLPWEVSWGFLGSKSESAEFLRTLWQVVAAALGVSVAMVAFAFQAFASSGQRAYGGSLREFSQQSRLLFVIELGLLSLLLDGIVLLGLGTNAPGGLPAVGAIAISVGTLLGVGFVMHRVVGLLDDRTLRELRVS